MDDWVGPTLHVFLASISKKLYLEDVPKKSDTASLPDTSCHSTVFIGCTQLRDLSVGRDIQITENMRLRNGTIPPPHLCPWPLLFPFFSGLTRESLPSLWSFSSATTHPFYSSAPDGLSALGEPIAKFARAEREGEVCGPPVLAILGVRLRSVGRWRRGPLWRSRATEGAVSVIRRHRRRGSRTTWSLWSARICGPPLLRQAEADAKAVKGDQISLGQGLSPPPAPCPIITTPGVVL